MKRKTPIAVYLFLIIGVFSFFNHLVKAADAPPVIGTGGSFNHGVPGQVPYFDPLGNLTYDTSNSFSYSSGNKVLSIPGMSVSGSVSFSDIITKGPWVDVRAYGAISGGSTTVNDKAFLDLINVFSTDHGGIGYVTIFVPTGHFKTSNSIDINTDVIKVRIVGNGWENSIIEHTGAASNGAVYVHGEIASGTAQGSNWFEARDISIGSTNGQGINLASAANVRLQNLEIFSAGSAANTAFIRVTQSNVVEGDHIRLGSGNLLGALGNYAPWNTVVFTYPPHGIYATNSATSLVTELHFSNVQLHTHVTSHAVRYETVSAPIGSFFGNTFNDCQFKLSASETGTTAADYYIDGASVGIFNSFSENVGTVSNVTLKGTYDIGSATLFGFNGNHGTIDIDQSNFGAFAFITSSQLKNINLTGTPGSYKIISTNSQYDIANPSSPLIESTGDRIGSNVITAANSSPTFYEGSGSNATLGIFPYAQTNASGGNLLIQKYRGSFASPLDVIANDSLGVLEWDGYVNGALQVGGYLNLYPTAVTGTDMTTQLDVHLRNGSGGNTIPFYITPSAAFANDLITKGPWVDMRAGFGFVGDNVTDDTASAQNAIAFAGSTKALLFPCSSFKITGTLVFKSNYEWIGCGINRTVINYSGSGTAISNDSILTDYPKISGMSITNVTSGTAGLELGHSRNGIFKDLIVNSFFTNYSIGKPDISIANYYNRFYNCFSYNGTIGFLLGKTGDGANSNSFFGCNNFNDVTALKFENATGTRIYGHQIQGAATAIDLLGGNDNKIEAYIEASTAGGTLASGTYDNILNINYDGSATHIVDNGFNSETGNEVDTSAYKAIQRTGQTKINTILKPIFVATSSQLFSLTMPVNGAYEINLNTAGIISSVGDYAGVQKYHVVSQGSSTNAYLISSSGDNKITANVAGQIVTFSITGAASFTAYYHVGLNISNVGSDGAGTRILPSFQILSTTNSLSDNTLKGQPGVSTNDNACEACIGYYVSKTVPPAGVAMSTTTAANITSMTLTAGDWQIGGTVTYTFSSTTSVTNLAQGWSTTSATLGTQGTYSDDEYAAMVPTATNTMTKVIPSDRLSTAGSVTLYLVAQDTFTLGGGTPLSASGTLWARRMR